MAHVRDQWFRPSASGSGRERTARYGVGRRWLVSYQDAAGRRHAKSFDKKVDAERYLALMEIKVVAVPPETASIALEAFDRYGKGRHPAQLNFGDCFAYACARHLAQPLMFKGADFPQTDIEAA